MNSKNRTCIVTVGSQVYTYSRVKHVTQQQSQMYLLTPGIYRYRYDCMCGSSLYYHPNLIFLPLTFLISMIFYLYFTYIYSVCLQSG